MEYRIEVENDIDNLTINATTSDKKAIVEGTGNYELKVGLNEIKITVIAEDKSTKEYKINVTRKEFVKQDINENVLETKDSKRKVNNKQKIILIAVSCILVGLIFCLIIKKVKNSKKK